MARIVSEHHVDPEAAQPFDGGALVEIGAGNPVALVVEEFRQATHADASDTDEVDVLDLAEHGESLS
jgi:hypothetical protein